MYTTDEKVAFFSLQVFSRARYYFCTSECLGGRRRRRRVLSKRNQRMRAQQNSALSLSTEGGGRRIFEHAKRGRNIHASASLKSKRLDKNLLFLLSLSIKKCLTASLASSVSSALSLPASSLASSPPVANSPQPNLEAQSEIATRDPRTKIH